MRRMATALLWIACGVASTRASAQGPGGDARLDGRLDPATRLAIEALVDSARREGLPGDPLVQKALEGAVKGAPADRVLAAVRSLKEALAGARDALGPRATAADLRAGAESLRLGASPPTLRDLATARDGGTLDVPLVTLADLLARGVPIDTAARIVLALAERRAPDGAYLEMQRAIERDIRGGVPPATAGSLRMPRGPIPVRPGAREPNRPAGPGRPSAARPTPPPAAP